VVDEELNLRASLCGWLRYHVFHRVWFRDGISFLIKLLQRLFLRKRSRLFALRNLLSLAFHFYALIESVQLQSLMLALLRITSVRTLLVLSPYAERTGNSASKKKLPPCGHSSSHWAGAVIGPSCSILGVRTVTPPLMLRI
jgi:hypothetical protein